jgi:hypothetical protein
MKKRALLIVGLALAIATAGLVYAHWTDTLKVDATVNTGTINMMWQAYGTDDDGLDNTGFYAANAESATDNGGGTLYDAWATASSNDPAEMWRCLSGTCGYKLGLPGLDRYDKDVAKCTVVPSGAKGLTATISNAYPSYHCTVFSQLSNEGTVPVKAAAFHLDTPGGGTLLAVGTEYVEAAFGTTATCNLPQNAGKCPMGIFVPAPAGTTEPVYNGMVPVVTFDFADGTACGNQLDPYASPTYDNDKNAVWFHVEESAAQNAAYTFHWEQDFVNWNEWKGMDIGPTGVLHANSCQIYINGVPQFTP